MPNPTIRGRLVSRDGDELWIRNEAGLVSVRSTAGSAHIDDVIEVGDDGAIRVLTRGRRSPSWMAHTLDPRRRRACELRVRVEAAIRAFFAARGFLETRTPIMVPCPGLEPHIRPFAIAGGEGMGFLHTSPEFAMKRLLVGGLERIFQIAPVFRDEPPSATHRPEFTMLEWYRAFADDLAIMRDSEELLAAIATAVHGAPRIPWQGGAIDVTPPWPRLRVRDLFAAHAGVDLVKDDLAAACRRHGLTPPDMSRDRSEGRIDPSRPGAWDEDYFKLWLNVVEPKLPADRAVIVTRYPVSQAALSVIDQDADGTSWARRFELYAGGLELGNAFQELTDPVEQRRRFVADLALRAALYGDDFPKTPIDEGFLRALEEGLPPSAGIAVGVDRLVMLIADEPDLDYTFWI